METATVGLFRVRQRTILITLEVRDWLAPMRSPLWTLAAEAAPLPETEEEPLVKNAFFFFSSNSIYTCSL